LFRCCKTKTTLTKLAGVDEMKKKSSILGSLRKATKEEVGYFGNFWRNKTDFANLQILYNPSVLLLCPVCQ